MPQAHTPSPAEKQRGRRPAALLPAKRVEERRTPPALGGVRRCQSRYFNQSGTSNLPLAYFGGYTTLVEPSEYHWMTTIDGAP